MWSNDLFIWFAILFTWPVTCIVTCIQDKKMVTNNNHVVNLDKQDLANSKGTLQVWCFYYPVCSWVHVYTLTVMSHNPTLYHTYYPNLFPFIQFSNIYFSLSVKGFSKVQTPINFYIEPKHKIIYMRLNVTGYCQTNLDFHFRGRVNYYKNFPISWFILWYMF